MKRSARQEWKTQCWDWGQQENWEALVRAIEQRKEGWSVPRFCLEHAIGKGQLDVVKIILKNMSLEEQGIKEHDVDLETWKQACKSGHWNVIQYFLAHPLKNIEKNQERASQNSEGKGEEVEKPVVHPPGVRQRRMKDQTWEERVRIALIQSAKEGSQNVWREMLKEHVKHEVQKRLQPWTHGGTESKESLKEKKIHWAMETDLVSVACESELKVRSRAKGDNKESLLVDLLKTWKAHEENEASKEQSHEQGHEQSHGEHQDNALNNQNQTHTGINHEKIDQEKNKSNEWKEKRQWVGGVRWKRKDPQSLQWKWGVDVDWEDEQGSCVESKESQGVQNEKGEKEQVEDQEWITWEWVGHWSIDADFFRAWMDGTFENLDIQKMGVILDQWNLWEQGQENFKDQKKDLAWPGRWPNWNSVAVLLSAGILQSNGVNGAGGAGGAKNQEYAKNIEQEVRWVIERFNFEHEMMPPPWMEDIRSWINQVKQEQSCWREAQELMSGIQTAQIKNKGMKDKEYEEDSIKKIKKL